jgi:hypothetical protein
LQIVYADFFTSSKTHRAAAASPASMNALSVIWPFFAQRSTLLPRISTTIFCGAGLLLSVSVLLLDQYIPGEWF